MARLVNSVHRSSDCSPKHACDFVKCSLAQFHFNEDRAMQLISQNPFYALVADENVIVAFECLTLTGSYPFFARFSGGPVSQLEALCCPAVKRLTVSTRVLGLGPSTYTVLSVFQRRIVYTRSRTKMVCKQFYANGRYQLLQL